VDQESAAAREATLSRPGFDPWRRPWLYVVILLAAVTAFPQIDLRISALFYVAGHGFPWRDSSIGLFVRHMLPRFIVASAATCLAAWAVGLWRRRPLWTMTSRRLAYLVASLLLGPGLIVESVLKPYWGRPRPEDLLQFGGTAAYAPPLWIAHGCSRNCSFASGHAAIAFWLTAYALLLPERWRREGFMAGVVIGLAVGLVRIMQGAHFFSDVVFAGAIVAGLNLLLAKVMINVSLKQPR
jgi:lipid A 4'-phosphatase